MSAPDDCLFCKIVAGEIPADIVHSTDTAVAFRDIAPQAPTHVLVVPRAHHSNAAELAAVDPTAAADLVRIAAEVAADGRADDDYRLVFNTGACVGQTRLPRPPAPARRALDVLAAGMSTRVLASAAAVVLLAACGPGADSSSRSQAPDAGPGSTATAATEGSAPAAPPKAAAAARLAPLRPGEKRLTLTMPEAYTPAAPTGVGTDDYRCFLLDPGLTEDTYLTGTNVLPGNPDVVHHVILFRVPPEQVAAARAKDDSTPGAGLDLLRRDRPRRVPERRRRALAGRLGAGRQGVRAPEGLRRPRSPRGRRSSCRSTTTCSPARARTPRRPSCGSPPRARPLTPLETMLLPAPVELPCRPGHDRLAAVRPGRRAGRRQGPLR